MKKCFVISPIGDPGTEIREHSDDVLEFIIQPAMEELGIKAYRSDHGNKLGNISEQMFDSILNDDLCIAVLTYQNPNVYYELAVAQSAARPVVILMQKGGEIPFDVSDLRIVWYDLKPRPLREGVYEREIVEKVRELEKSDWKVAVPFGADLSPLGRETGRLEVFAKAELYGSSDQWLHLLGESQKRLRVCGISLHAWTRYRGIRKVLLERAEQGCDIRLMIMSPENPALSHLLNESDGISSLERVQSGIERAFDFFQDVASQSPLINIRRVSRGSIHNQVLVNDSRLVLIPYMFSRATFQSPLVLTDCSSPLHEAFEREFDALWDANDGEAGGAPTT